MKLKSINWNTQDSTQIQHWHWVWKKATEFQFTSECKFMISVFAVHTGHWTKFSVYHCSLCNSVTCQIIVSTPDGKLCISVAKHSVEIIIKGKFSVIIHCNASGAINFPEFIIIIRDRNRTYKTFSPKWKPWKW